MRIFRVENSYRRSFQGGSRHVLIRLVTGSLDPADTPIRCVRSWRAILSGAVTIGQILTAILAAVNIVKLVS